MLPDQVDHLLEEFEQRLVTADPAPDHHAAVVSAGQRLDDRLFGVLVERHQAPGGLEIMIIEAGPSACYRCLDRLRVPALDLGGIEPDHQYSCRCHASSLTFPCQ